MSGAWSRLGRQGSHSSLSSTSSIDQSSHNHIFRSLQSLRDLQTLRDWARTNNRIDRIATGTIARGTAILTRDTMELHISRAPEIRSFADCQVVANRRGSAFAGWRQKGYTWPQEDRQANA